MNTLDKILKQDLIVSEQSQKLKDLQNKYIKEEAKFKTHDIVRFKQYDSDDEFIKGIIQRIHYKEIHEMGLIQYCIFRIKKDGSRNKRDQSFYYRHEKELKL